MLAEWLMERWWLTVRDLVQNQQPVFYRLYEGIGNVYDDDGNFVGQEPTYSMLKCAMLSVSPNKGTSESEQFGTLADYDRTMTTSDTACPIDEDSILWVDNADTNKPHNYVVTKRAPWKNSISFAINQVTISDQFGAMRNAENNNQPEQPIY